MKQFKKDILYPHILSLYHSNDINQEINLWRIEMEEKLQLKDEKWQHIETKFNDFFFFVVSGFSSFSIFTFLLKMDSTSMLS